MPIVYLISFTRMCAGRWRKSLLESYFLTLINDSTRKVFIYFMKKESDATKIVQEIKSFDENHTGRCLKILRTDNGTGYLSNELQGILKRDSTTSDNDAL